MSSFSTPGVGSGVPRSRLAKGNRFAGYHADVAYFLKERGVSFIGGDGPNDVVPTGLPASVPNPLHRLALVAMGIKIFDNLDFRASGRAVEDG